MPQSKPKHVRAAAPAQSAAIKVLVAVDGSDYTNRMLDFLVRNIGIIPKQPEFTVLHAVSVGSMRYRLPADVPMSIVAAAAVARCRVRCANQP